MAADVLDATFAALADPTRRAILARLMEGEATVTELAAPFAMSQPAISKHLRVLERAGLISRGRDAQRRPRRLEPGPLRDAMDWLADYRSYWEESYRRLDDLLADLEPGEANTAERENPRPGDANVIEQESSWPGGGANAIERESPRPGDADAIRRDNPWPDSAKAAERESSWLGEATDAAERESP